MIDTGSLLLDFVDVLIVLDPEAEILLDVDWCPNLRAKGLEFGCHWAPWQLFLNF